MYKRQILDILKLCDQHILIDAIGEILEERAIYLQENDIKINVLDYVSLDIIKENKAIPFDIVSGRVKVCFADTSNRKSTDVIRLLLLNKGLVMDRYITFESNIDNIVNSLEGVVSDDINTNTDAVSYTHLDVYKRQFIQWKDKNYKIQKMSI